MAVQDQFLNVIDRDEAERRFRAALNPQPLDSETVSLEEALGRVLSHDIYSDVDVPSFDRSNVDGYALRAADTCGATELAPQTISLLSDRLEAGDVPQCMIASGTAVMISTGGMIPRGADAVLMTEHADIENSRLVLRRPVTPGQGISFAGTDIASGETVLRAGTVLSSRETGVLAAIGCTHIPVRRLPRVLVISTGNEIISPGDVMQPGRVYDSNSRVLCDAVRETGGIPIWGGIVRDDQEALRYAVRQGLSMADVVLLSGGTSKGQGDLCYRVVAEFDDPGIVVHGVALKPGKPLCLAVSGGRPIVILPGFPTSAIFTFHEFVAPVIRMMGGHRQENRPVVSATTAVRVRSEIGRTEYLLVGLVDAERGLTAYPMGRGSGSVTTFGLADGFVTIPRHTEILPAGQTVSVQLLGCDRTAADLTVIGSHCVGLDFLLSQLQQQGFRTKMLTVGSTAGLTAAIRAECDLAGIHLLDAESGIYNRRWITEAVKLTDGYLRQQGLVFRVADERFQHRTAEEILGGLIDRPDCLMVNRNQGSGTRILIDRLLAGRQPAGYAVQPGNHNAVTAAVSQGRADWGIAIESVARRSGLSFLPLQEEHFDFVIPVSRRHRPAVEAFLELLQSPTICQQLRTLGCHRIGDHIRNENV